MRVAFSETDIIVCDTWKEAVDWNAKQFATTPVYGNDDYSRVFIPTYDLCFCGSLLTHLNEQAATACLHFMLDNLKQGGLLIIATHGRKAIDCVRVSMPPGVFANESDFKECVELYQAGEWAYRNYDHSKNYGFSFNPVNWFWKIAEQRNDFTVLNYMEKCYNNHQDIAVLRKENL